MQGHDSTRLVVPGQDTPRVLVPGWDLQRLAVSQQVVLPEPDARRVLLAGQDGKPVLLPQQDGKTHFLASQDGQRIILSGRDGQNSKILVAGQKVILPTTNAQFSLPAQQDTQVTKLMLECDGQKMLLPTPNGQRMLQGQNIVRHNQDSQKLILAGQDGQAFILSGQDSQKLFVFGADEKTPSREGIGKLMFLSYLTFTYPVEVTAWAVLYLLPSAAGKKRQHIEDNPLIQKLARVAAPAASEPPVVLMYRPVLANQQPQLVSTAVLQPHSSHSANSTAYTIVTAPQKPHTSSVPSSQPTAILSSSPHTFTTSAPHILTSSPIVTSSTSQTSLPPSTQAPTTNSPTVVNGLVHLKTSKKPAMDISCLTKEGVARARTPPPLLQVQKKAAKKVTAIGLRSSTDTREPSNLGRATTDKQQQPQTQIEGRKTSAAVTRNSKGQDTGSQQENQVVLVQASPPTTMQRMLVVGEKGEAIPQSLVLPVAYDQQLVSMPIYRVGSSLGGLQPVQLLTSLPTGGGGSSITTA